MFLQFLFLSEYFSHVQVLWFSLTLSLFFWGGVSVFNSHLFWFDFWLFKILFSPFLSTVYFNFGRILNYTFWVIFRLLFFSRLNSYSCWFCWLSISLVFLMCFGVCFCSVILNRSFLFCFLSFHSSYPVFLSVPTSWPGVPSLKQYLISKAWFPWLSITSGSVLPLQE